MLTRIALAAISVATVTAACNLSEPRFQPIVTPPAAAAALTAAQPAYDFGTIVLGGSSAPASMMFVNTGSAATGELGAAALGGSAAVLFALGADGCAHRILAPGDSCTVSAQLSPSSAGAGSASLTVAGMPGGTAAVALIGTVVEPGALRITPATTAFGGVAPGATSAHTTFTVTNTGGASSGQLSVSISGSDAPQFTTASDRCTGAILAAGGTCTIDAWFAPTAAGSRAASLTVASVAAGTAVAALGGNGLTPATLAVSPATTNIGSVVVGATSAPATLTFSNVGQLPTGAISISQSGDGGQYQRGTDGCSGASLAPASSCTVALVFAPLVTGPAAVAVTASAVPGGAITANVAGTGIPPAALAFTPASNDYGPVDVGGQSTPTMFTLQNTGGQRTSTITTSLQSSNASDYAIVTDTCNGSALAAGATCRVGVVFAPATFGVRSATLEADAGTGGTTAASLTGTGRDKLTLTVLTSGDSGTGTVTSSIGGLTCSGTTCTASYYRDTAFTLTAVPDSGNLFKAWSGPCTGSGVCSLTLDVNLTVTAAFVPAFEKLMFATTGVNGASGTLDVAASQAATSCGAGCSQFPYGTTVTLTARPTTGYYLGSWSGDCIGNGLGCVLTMTTAHSATAAFSPANLVFVTSGKFVPSSTNTVTWADSTCQSAAQAAGLAGTYIGWIGAGLSTWSSRLGNASGWVRRDGKPFAVSKDELLDDHSLYPDQIDEHGTAVSMTALVNSGEPVIGGGAPGDCMGWTQTASSGAFQLPGQVGGGWGTSSAATVDEFDDDNPAARCGSPLPLHCFEVDYSVNLTYTRQTGRIAFVGDRGFSPFSGGLAEIDQYCADQAAAAGLAGTYRALVATSTSSAASRFSTTGAPWVRPDGVPIVAQAADLFAASGPVMTASLDITATGVATNNSVITGSLDFNTAGTSTTTCLDYTFTGDTTSGRYVIDGSPTFVGPTMVGFGGVGCNQGGSVYCLQQ